MDILLIEPNYKCKYPPLGLMKISTYHREIRQDNITFFKGDYKQAPTDKLWDRVYITTLFTFHYQEILEAINFAKKVVANNEQIFVGGVAATLLAKKIYQDTGIKPHCGLLTSSRQIGFSDDVNIDLLTPDYSILTQDTVSYTYPAANAYYGYTTRGCKNNCGFCAVKTLEPKYQNYISIKRQIREIDEKYGPKKDLLLLDNNVLASDRYTDIIEEILQLGFEKGARFNGKPRYVDFNQGLDARFATAEKMHLLAQLNIKPVRIAFDNIRLKDTYIRAIKWAVKAGIKHLSNYVLFNFQDTPVDFYNRLRINIDLNEELGTSIYSFPMKYAPLNKTTRKHKGKYWTFKQLRGVQCILNATRGVVGPKSSFFYKAFGESPDEFLKIILMPERYIIYRAEYKKSAADWEKKYLSLSRNERKEFESIIADNKFNKEILSQTRNARIREILELYLVN